MPRMSTASDRSSTITTPWPAGFPADRSGITGFAVREVAAPADAVYQWLLRPDLHGEFYKALHGFKLRSGGGPELEVGHTVSFFLGALFVPPVKVVQADPELRSFAWAAGGPGMKACHCFTVQPIDEHTSLLRSEEKWVGPVARLISPVVKGQLQKVQTEWAQAIADAAARHPAGPPSA